MSTETRPALSFDGVDDCIDCGDNPAHALESAFTLEAWIYAKSRRSRAGIITKHLDGRGDELGYALQQGGEGNLRLALRAVDGDRVEAVSSAPGSLPTEAWHHVAGTFDGALMRLYIDGEPVGEAPASGPALNWFPANDLFIALTRAGDGEDHFFHGMIGQVRVWSRAKSGDEIKAGMSTRASGDEDGLASSWPLDEGAGDSVTDEGPAGQAGGVEGGPSWTDSELPFPDAAKPRPSGDSRVDALGKLELDFYRAGSINKEYVILTNSTDAAIDLSGLEVLVPTAMKRVKDAGKNRFVFPGGVSLEPGKFVVIHAQRDDSYEFDTTLPLFYSIDGITYVDTVQLRYAGELVKERSKGTDQPEDGLGPDPDHVEGAPPPPPPAPEPENLTKIEGIGPKTEELLQAAKIRTYAELAGSSVNQLQAILDAAGRRYSLLQPGTWPEQAALAAAGEWSELAKLQAVLDGGVRD